ncbi:hypothetical protein DM02DRAFT_620679 [Periconia macrospinosa]|uniref:Uncharacterized protein n=1 Tax=Periconia macrospinosa TaxID=97972 RepID=A0A2V1CZJ6_9PLEO|nr:hypothetical protein DM02DRAFT_620679 [Periconia macrospinosa]
MSPNFQDRALPSRMPAQHSCIIADQSLQPNECTSLLLPMQNTHQSSSEDPSCSGAICTMLILAALCVGAWWLWKEGNEPQTINFLDRI